jgi:hypothetical protein
VTVAVVSTTATAEITVELLRMITERLR